MLLRRGHPATSSTRRLQALSQDGAATLARGRKVVEGLLPQACVTEGKFLLPCELVSQALGGNTLNDQPHFPIVCRWARSECGRHAGGSASSGSRHVHRHHLGSVQRFVDWHLHHRCAFAGIEKLCGRFKRTLTATPQRPERQRLINVCRSAPARRWNAASVLQAPARCC